MSQDLGEFLVEQEAKLEVAKISETRAEPLIRRIFRHWRLAIAASLFIWSLIEFVSGPLRVALELKSKWLIMLVFFFPGLAFLALWIKERLSRVSTLADPEGVDQILASHSGKLGRTQDIEQILELCSSSPVVHLIGESGVGKSSLLRVGLSEAMTACNRFLPVYLESLGAEWDESEELFLRDALLKALGLAGNASKGRSVLQSILSEEAQLAGRIPVFIFDEFNSYIARHRSLLVDSSTGSWIPTAELCRHSKFWRRIFGLSARRKVRVLFAVRSDESDALFPFSEKQFSVRRLNKLESQLITAIAREIDGCVKDVNNGWYALSGQILEDLSRSHGYILPIEASLVFAALKTMPNLTLREYGNIGGVNGLIGRRISAEIEGSANATLKADAILHALTALYNADSYNLSLRTASEIHEHLALCGVKATSNSIVQVFALLSQRRIVRECYQAGSTAPVWTLYHSYVARAVARLVNAQQSDNNRLAIMYSDFRSASGYVRWSKLLPPLFSLRLISLAILGRIDLRKFRGYILASAVRIVPYGLLLFLPVTLADLGLQTPGGTSLRRILDSYGMSVFRRPAPGREIEQVAARMASDMYKIVEGRRNPQGFIMSRDRMDDVHDLWSHSQASAAILKAYSSREITAQVLSSIRPLFNTKWAIKQNGICYGWSQRWYPDPDSKQLREMQTESFPRAEILLWTANVVFLLWERVEESSRNELREWTSFVECSMTQFWGSGLGRNAGAWNRYPNQANGPRDYSVYISALAIEVLLGAKKTGLSVKVAGLDQYELIRQSADWIWDSRVVREGKTGWSDEGRPDIIPLDGLSLQVYSALVQSARASLIKCPESLISDNITYIRMLAESSGLRDMTSRRLQVFKNSFEHQKFVEYPLTFLTYPWLLISVSTLLDEDGTGCRKLNPEERRYLYAVLSSLLVSRGEHELSRTLADDPYVYRRSEALLAFAKVREISARLP